ncbi:MAG: aminopeptidase P family protein, partial [Clostridia bacterium]|nr:aminopeptidase P family protein [Clostridia bacterium]
MTKKLRFVTDKTAVLLLTSVNRRYLTGFSSSLGYLLLTKKGNFLFADGRYIEAAQKQASNATVLKLENIAEQLNQIFKEQGTQKLLIEVENDISTFTYLKKALIVKVSASAALSQRLKTLRSIKTSAEVECTIAAQRIAERAFEEILNFIKVGVTEREIAAFLEYKMKSFGSEGFAFDTIVVSGKNSSMPHGVPTDKPIEAGDFITMDYGAVYGGYLSDMTRTVAVGHVTDEMNEVYNTVLKAQEAVIKVAKQGITCDEADKAARQVIENAGYGEFFTHSTGHGVGLEIHET